MKALWKTERFRAETGDKISKWSKYPKSSDTFWWTNLILIKSQFCFAVPEEEFDFPSFYIEIQYLFCRKWYIGGNKCSECFRITHLTDRKTDKNNCIVNAVEFAFIAKDIVLMPFYSHGAKRQVTFFQSCGKPADTAFYPFWINNAVCFQSSYGVKSLDDKAVDHFVTYIPAVTKQIWNHCPQLKRLKDIYQCWKRQI